MINVPISGFPLPKLTWDCTNPPIYVLTCLWELELCGAPRDGERSHGTTGVAAGAGRDKKVFEYGQMETGAGNRGCGCRGPSLRGASPRLGSLLTAQPEQSPCRFYSNRQQKVTPVPLGIGNRKGSSSLEQRVKMGFTPPFFILVIHFPGPSPASGHQFPPGLILEIYGP